jgi:hypothetical protein
MLSGMLLLFGCTAPTNGAGVASVTESSPPVGAVPAPTTGQGSESPAAGASPGVDGPSVPAAVSPAAHSEDAPPGLVSGNLGVTDQNGDGTQLRLAAEFDGGPGWVVVQADRNGRPGKVLGLTHRKNGAHDDVVTVALHPRVATGLLWVTMYLDNGRQGVFEHPGADTPLQFAGQDLQRSATLTVTDGLVVDKAQ